MNHEVVQTCKSGMQKRMVALDQELSRVRTGRASITVLDGVRVNYYGTPTPINQVATLSTPDARSIVVAPFEKSLIGEIEKSIMKADIGLQPTNDGNVIRLPIPQLTEDRRKDIVKSLKKIGEEAKVGIRQVRQKANDAIKKIEKNKELPEDELKKLQAAIQKETDGFVKMIDDKMAAKEKEVMTI